MCQFRRGNGSVGVLLLIPECSPPLTVAASDVGIGLGKPDCGVIWVWPHSPSLVASVLLKFCENFIACGRPTSGSLSRQVLAHSLASTSFSVADCSCSGFT